jgi:hypothetical protein
MDPKEKIVRTIPLDAETAEAATELREAWMGSSTHADPEVREISDRVYRAACKAVTGPLGPNQRATISPEGNAVQVLEMA